MNTMIMAIKIRQLIIRKCLNMIIAFKKVQIHQKSDYLYVIRSAFLVDVGLQKYCKCTGQYL